jgi:hypothetical protein
MVKFLKKVFVVKLCIRSTTNLKNSNPKVDIKSRKMNNKTLKMRGWLKLIKESPKIEVKRKEETSVTQ